MKYELIKYDEDTWDLWEVKGLFVIEERLMATCLVFVFVFILILYDRSRKLRAYFINM